MKQSEHLQQDAVYDRLVNCIQHVVFRGIAAVSVALFVAAFPKLESQLDRTNLRRGVNDSWRVDQPLE